MSYRSDTLTVLKQLNQNIKASITYNIISRKFIRKFYFIL